MQRDVGPPRGMKAASGGGRRNGLPWGSALVLLVGVLGAPQEANAQGLRLTAGDPSGDALFGEPAALDGDLLVVGARRFDEDTGAAYVFRRVGGTWAQEQKLTATDGAPRDGFGNLAVSGDVIVVGAMDDVTSAGANAGSAYVFELRDGAWVEVQQLTPSDAEAGIRFGTKVAIDGDVLMISALFDGDSGAVYAFTRVGDAWVEQQKLVATTRVQDAFFGRSLALEGHRLVVGAVSDTADDGRTVLDAGAAYVFERAAGSWTETAKLVAPDAAVGNGFGLSVDLSGDTILVGSFADEAADGRTIGSAHVFTLDQGAWRHTQKLVASEAPDRFVFFGTEVALDGTRAVVSAPGVESLRGRIYAFTQQGTSWVETGRFQPTRLASGDGLGNGLSLDGDIAVAGAPRSREAGNEGAGAAYVFELPLPDPIRFADGNLPNGFVGQPYDHRLDVVGGASDRTELQFSASGLPAGLVLTDQGVIEGTPVVVTPEAGESVELTVVDPEGDSDSVIRRLIVLGPSPLEITTTELPDAQLGEPYGFDLSSQGGFGEVRFRTVFDGVLPEGLELDEAGTISGVATELGGFDFDVEATDTPLPGGVPGRAERSLMLQVDGTYVEVVEQNLAPVEAGADFSFTLRASGGVPPYAWRLEPETALPTGAEVQQPTDSDAFVLSGSVADPSTTVVSVRVTDATGRQDTAEFRLVVEALPSGCTPPDPACTPGQLSKAEEEDCGCTTATTTSRPPAFALLALGMLILCAGRSCRRHPATTTQSDQPPDDP